MSDPAAARNQLAGRSAAQSLLGFALTGWNERQIVLRLQANEGRWAVVREDHPLKPLWLRSKFSRVLASDPVRREQVRRRAATGDIEQIAYICLADVRIMPRSPA